MSKPDADRASAESPSSTGALRRAFGPDAKQFWEVSRGWFRLGLIGLAGLTILGLAWILPEVRAAETELDAFIGYVLAGLVGLGVLSMVLAALWLKLPGLHSFVARTVGGVVEFLVFAVTILAIAEAATAGLDVPRLASVVRLDTSFDLLWGNLAALGQAWEIPLVLGAATGPVLLFILSIFAGARFSEAVSTVRQVKKEPRPPKKAPEASRALVLKAYGDTKKLLERSRKDLTFLSLDIVGSTQMKVGEDSFVVEEAFLAYRRLVEGLLDKHNAWKQTWTPDGQMAAFRDPQDAVNCGRDVLLALPAFNRDKSRLGTDFRLRVGANRGVVSIEEDTPLEEVSDFMIDVAGHMQKHADVDSFWIPKFLYYELEDAEGFEATSQVVDNHDVFAWSPPDDTAEDGDDG